MQTSGYEEMLSYENFMFWLSFSNKIVPHVDIVYNQKTRNQCGLYQKIPAVI